MNDSIQPWDHVEKVGGDYKFEGIVVSKFHKLTKGVGPLKWRFVVEDDRGVLHILSESNLRRIQHYADPKLYMSGECGHQPVAPIELDSGEKARKALE